MIKPILMPIYPGSKKFEQKYVLVHICGNGLWGYSIFGGNGCCQGGSYSYTAKEKAQEAAREQRKRLRKIAKGLV